MKQIMIFIFIFLIMFTFIKVTAEESETYGNYETEWKTFVTSSPVTAFTVFKNKLFYSTQNGIAGTYDLKTNSKNVIKTIANVPSNKIICMNSNDFLWVGTENGLIQSKDGVSYKLLTTKNGLIDNKINKIWIDSENKIWIGTDNGISILQQGTWVSYNKDNGLSGNNVRDIVSVQNNKIWVATNNGISVFDGSDWSNINTFNDLGSNDIKALAYDSKTNDIWVACGESDVARNHSGKWEVFMNIMQNIKCIMVDTQSRVWVGSSTEGLRKYTTFEWIGNPQKIGFGAISVNSVDCDSLGDLWFGLERGIMHMSNPYPY